MRSGVSAHRETVHGDAINGDGAEWRGDEWGVAWIYRGVGGEGVRKVDDATRHGCFLWRILARPGRRCIDHGKGARGDANNVDIVDK